MERRHLVVDDGTSIGYIVGGADDAPIVFVHGWCSNAGHFEHQLVAFAPEHRVLAIDRRGHGSSEIVDAGYTAERHADDLRAVLDHEGLEQVVIVGHAGGCPSVLHFAAHNSDRCEALVLLDTRISPRADLRGADRSSPLAQMVAAIADDTTFEQIYRGFVDARRPELVERVVNDAMRVPRAVAQEDLASLAIDTVSLAARVRCPVLWVAAGDVDRTALREAFDTIDFHVVTDSGHFVQLEVPDQVNDAIATFLDTDPIRSPRIG